jgi:hypothetical protein
MKSRGSQFDQLSLGIGEGTSQTWQPAAHVTEGAARFSREHGRRPTDYTGLDTLQYPTQKAYAGHKEYDANAGQPASPRTTASYESMRADVGAQFAHLTKPESQGGMGFHFEATPLMSTTSASRCCPPRRRVGTTSSPTKRTISSAPCTTCSATLPLAEASRATARKRRTGRTRRCSILSRNMPLEASCVTRPAT